MSKIQDLVARHDRASVRQDAEIFENAETETFVSDSC